ncbi:MAG: SIMPL domain-containing protein [Proteobacteria bacterium]|nr:SIMPL domain-containing protein [Pseudomonadota bacterium]
MKKLLNYQYYFLASLLTFSLFPYQSFAEDIKTRIINVTGNGKSYLKPDIANITFSVHTENRNISDALNNNNSRTQKLTETLKANHVDAKDIQSSSFNIYPEQQYDNNGRPTGATTFTIDNSISTTIRQIDRLGDILTSAVESGANNISGLQFDSSNRENAISQARKYAVDDAINQAKQLATAANLTLGNILSISHRIDSFQSPLPLAFSGNQRAESLSAPASVPISTGQMLVSVYVDMVFEIK